MKPWLILLATVCILPGCVTPTPPLPTVEWDTLEDARQILIDRQASIDSVQAQLKLKITSPPPESETHTLDAALVIRGDDHFRLRAWKLNQTIFDLTATPDGTFIVANEEMKKRTPDAEQDLAKLTEQLGAMLRGPDWAQATFTSDRDQHNTKMLGVTWGHGYSIIDSRTLEPRVYEPAQRESTALARVETRYAIYDRGLWYATVTAVGDFGRVELIFRDVELNGELNPRAFKPSRRAVRIDALRQVPENPSP